nr:MAG TPA: hypothetical protein [Caudoviricetes sp.]
MVRYYSSPSARGCDNARLTSSTRRAPSALAAGELFYI